MLSELENHSKVTGVKQSKKAVEEGRAAKVFLAEDADPAVTEPLFELCEKHSVPVVYVKSMAEMGKVCGIAVGAAVAALLK